MTTWNQLEVDIHECRVCPRLVAWRENIALEKKRSYKNDTYWGKPVAGFGDYQAKVLVVGLAPGAHGSNRTGRMFTGDSSGEFLYAALHRYGFANQANAKNRDDGLVLEDLFISAVCRCAPPENKPLPEELMNCQHFLIGEMTLLQKNLVGIVALGRVAFDQILNIYRGKGVTIPRVDFEHGKTTLFEDGLPWLVSSYHPSRQNTQTGRLTTDMFDRVWETVRSLL